MAHACNPSYSGGRDQEEGGWRTAQENSLRGLISKTLHKNRAGGVAQGVDPEFNPWYHIKKKKRENIICYICIYIYYTLVMKF
jgi:hypothetical protein